MIYRGWTRHGEAVLGVAGLVFDMLSEKSH